MSRLLKACWPRSIAIAPGSPEGIHLRGALSVLRETAGIERESLKNLILGNYQKVVELTSSVIDGRRATRERILFYAACGRAGLSLVGAKEADVLRAEASSLFTQATKSRNSIHRKNSATCRHRSSKSFARGKRADPA